MPDHASSIEIMVLSTLIGPWTDGEPVPRKDEGGSAIDLISRMGQNAEAWTMQTTTPPTSEPVKPSIGEYLVRRLQDYGIDDLFGIPGDYVLSFYTMLEESPIQTIGCTREDCAGFAADAYARVRGMGALCVTYCVGGLSV